MSNTRLSQYKSIRDWRKRMQINYFHIGVQETRRVYKFATFAQELRSVKVVAREDGFKNVIMVLPLFTKLNLN